MRAPYRPLAVLLGCLQALAACGEDPAPGCRIAQVVDLPATPLTRLADVRLDRAGLGFVLIGTDDKKDLVRFARLSETGEVTGEATATIPARVLGPFFGATTASAPTTAPGDQLLVVFGTASATAPGAIALQVLALNAGAAAASGPRPLQDPDGKDVVIPAGATAVQAAMGTAISGNRALFTWGQGTQPAAPEVLLLGADGATSRPSGSVAAGPTPWDCLAVVPSRADFGISRLVRPTGPGGRPSWTFAEFKDDGTVTYTLAIDSSTAEMGCPTVAPTPKGYAIAWQNTHGTYFSDVDITRERIFVTSDIVRGAVRFGGPDRQPPLASVAAMGKEFGIVYATSSGPLVDRFTIFGNPRGGSLHLPSRGRSGLVSAWPRVDAMFMTYLDRGTDPASDVRPFAKVDCPAQ